jgi:hypothetical protein
MLPLVACLVLSLATQTPARAPSPGGPSREEVRAAIDRAVAFLRGDQKKEGSWGGPRNTTYTDLWTNPETHFAWRVGTTGLACMALLEAGGAGEDEAALGRGLDFLAANPSLQRSECWDLDHTWGLVYGLQALARALRHPRTADSPRRDAMRSTAERILETLLRYQSPNGGWGYYAYTESAWRPEWATSFQTAAALLALFEAREAGLAVDGARIAAGLRAVKRCRLPTGAYTYSVMAIPNPGDLEGIDQVKGSLGRIQVCNLALLAGGEKVPLDELRRGISLFFEHHRFLDVARRKPIPHEAYYRNAGYFYFFGHFYAAGVIERLPAEERDPLWSRLQREILKTQEPEGSMWDHWMSDYSRPWGTAYGVLALSRSIAPRG